MTYLNIWISVHDIVSLLYKLFAKEQVLMLERLVVQLGFGDGINVCIVNNHEYELKKGLKFVAVLKSTNRKRDISLFWPFLCFDGNSP